MLAERSKYRVSSIIVRGPTNVSDQCLAVSSPCLTGCVAVMGNGCASGRQNLRFMFKSSSGRAANARKSRILRGFRPVIGGVGWRPKCPMNGHRQRLMPLKSAPIDKRDRSRISYVDHGHLQQQCTDLQFPKFAE